MLANHKVFLRQITAGCKHNSVRLDKWLKLLAVEDLTRNEWWPELQREQQRRRLVHSIWVVHIKLESMDKHGNNVKWLWNTCLSYFSSRVSLNSWYIQLIHKVQTVWMAEKNISKLLILNIVLYSGCMAQGYRGLTFCAWGSWGACSNPGGATSIFFFVFFLSLYFYPLANVSVYSQCF